MVEVITMLGRIDWQCPRCEAKRRGLCWACGKRRGPNRERAWFCETCYRRNNARSKKAHASTDFYKLRQAQYDARRRHDPSYRERRAQNKRDWIARNPHKLAEHAAKARQRYWAKKRSAGTLDT